MFLHTNLRQREKFLCTTTDLQQRAIRANTTKTPPTTDMSIPTKNTVLEPWQFSVCVLYVCNSSSSPSSSLAFIIIVIIIIIITVRCGGPSFTPSRMDYYLFIYRFIFYLFAKRGFTPSQFTQCRRVVRFGIFVSESHSMQTDRDGRQKQTRNREANIST